MSQRKYNYVIFGSDWDLYLHSYSDIMSLDDVRYISDRKRHQLRLNNIVYRIHTGGLNRFINLPLKSFWNKYYFGNDFKDNKPICFIFTGSWICLNTSFQFSKYLRRTYQDCKIICFHQDLFHTKINPFSGKHLDVDTERALYDLIFSFDQLDCRNYNFIYHPLVYSAVAPEDNPHLDSDIYFLGQAKNRLDDIIEIYKVLRQFNLKLDINLVGVPKERQVYNDEIHYLDSFMSYKENLQHLLKSRCVLEIMQKGGHGFTQRVVEVVGENKKLITNNPEIKSAPFFNPKYISQFTDSDDIDSCFVGNICNDEIVDYHFKEKLSPVEFLNFVEENLNVMYR